MPKPQTTADPYAAFRLTLDEARQRLEHVTALRDESIKATAAHDAEIANLRRVIVSLAAMVGEPTEMESIGITDACRAVLTAATGPLKLRNVCDQLSDVGFDSNAQNNLDQSVQAVLNRMVEKKEIDKRVVPAPHNKTVTIYVGPKVTKAQLNQTLTDIGAGKW